MTGLAAALQLGRVWRGVHHHAHGATGAVPEVRFKDLGALPVCGGSIRPAASQRAMAQVTRRRGQP
jgi:hypothetical protein